MTKKEFGYAYEASSRKEINLNMLLASPIWRGLLVCAGHAIQAASLIYSDMNVQQGGSYYEVIPAGSNTFNDQCFRFRTLTLDL